MDKFPLALLIVFEFQVDKRLKITKNLLELTFLSAWLIIMIQLYLIEEHLRIRVVMGSICHFLMLFITRDTWASVKADKTIEFLDIRQIIYRTYNVLSIIMVIH